MTDCIVTFDSFSSSWLARASRRFSSTTEGLPDKRLVRTGMRFLVISGGLCLLALYPFDVVRAQQTTSDTPITPQEA